MTHLEEFSDDSSSTLTRISELSQLEFELDFFAGVLRRDASLIDVLRAHGHNLTLSGRYREGLAIDQQLIQLRPHDPVAHYNLACAHCLLEQPELAIAALRRAIELGYRDFRYLRADQDLDGIRNDPRFDLLMREFECV